MSNIEKIRQEIERLTIDYLNRSYTFVPVAMQQLLEFIDSLPEETCKDSLQVPETCKENTDSFTDDLEEAAEEYADKHGFRVPYDGSINYYDDVDVKASKDGFIAGAEWQKRQVK